MGRRREAGTILVADDDLQARSAIAEQLRRARYETIAVASGEAALDEARRERPALVVLDVSLRGLSAYEVCRSLREDYGDALPIIFVSRDRTESRDRVAGLLIGADDYLAKPFAPDELIARVEALVRRTRGSHNGVATPRSHLTPREHEILRVLAAGLPQAEIATHLVISQNTVATHIERVLGKLRVHSRAQAVALTYRDGLIELPA